MQFLTAMGRTTRRLCDRHMRRVFCQSIGGRSDPPSDLTKYICKLTTSAGESRPRQSAADLSALTQFAVQIRQFMFLKRQCCLLRDVAHKCITKILACADAKWGRFLVGWPETICLWEYLKHIF